MSIYLSPDPILRANQISYLASLRQVAEKRGPQAVAAYNRSLQETLTLEKARSEAAGDPSWSVAFASETQHPSVIYSGMEPPGGVAPYLIDPYAGQRAAQERGIETRKISEEASPSPPSKPYAEDIAEGIKFYGPQAEPSKPPPSPPGYIFERSYSEDVPHPDIVEAPPIGVKTTYVYRPIEALTGIYSAPSRREAPVSTIPYFGDVQRVANQIVWSMEDVANPIASALEKNVFEPYEKGVTDIQRRFEEVPSMVLPEATQTQREVAKASALFTSGLIGTVLRPWYLIPYVGAALGGIKLLELAAIPEERESFVKSVSTDPTGFIYRAAGGAVAGYLGTKAVIGAYRKLSSPPESLIRLEEVKATIEPKGIKLEPTVSREKVPSFIAEEMAGQPKPDYLLAVETEAGGRFERAIIMGVDDKALSKLMAGKSATVKGLGGDVLAKGEWSPLAASKYAAERPVSEAFKEIGYGTPWLVGEEAVKPLSFLERTTRFYDVKAGVSLLKDVVDEGEPITFLKPSGIHGIPTASATEQILKAALAAKPVISVVKETPSSLPIIGGGLVGAGGALSTMQRPRAETRAVVDEDVYETVLGSVGPQTIPRTQERIESNLQNILGTETRPLQRERSIEETLQRERSLENIITISGVTPISKTSPITTSSLKPLTRTGLFEEAKTHPAMEPQLKQRIRQDQFASSIVFEKPTARQRMSLPPIAGLKLARPKKALRGGWFPRKYPIKDPLEFLGELI